MDVAEELVQAFLAAYRPYLGARLAAMDASIDDAVFEAGEGWLERSLKELVQLAYADQARSPLEVFQESLRFPTGELERQGRPRVARDPGQEAALPGDVYDLAPVSSAELGERAWQAHFAWGAAKAAALAPAAKPTVLTVSRNLLDRSRIEQAAAEFRVVGWEPGEDPPRATIAFVDLEHPGADNAIRALAEAGIRAVGYGPHIDDWAMSRALALGATEALPRSRFFRDLSDLLPAVT